MLLHPCPRQRHHPGEHCNCAQKLNLSIPHGYCRKGDMGDLHAARAQNLRWRVSYGAVTGDSSWEVPASLKSLAEDHTGDAAVKALRPLSPCRIPRCGGHGAIKVRLSKLKQSGHDGEVENTSASESPGADISGAQVARPEKLCVSFSERLEAEVPLITLIGPAGRLKVPRMRRRVPTPMSQNHASREDMARVNMNRLVANHNQVTHHVEKCFAFLEKYLQRFKVRASWAQIQRA